MHAVVYFMLMALLCLGTCHASPIDGSTSDRSESNVTPSNASAFMQRQSYSAASSSIWSRQDKRMTDKVAQRRKKRVADLQEEFHQLQSNILYKDAKISTQSERWKVAEFRHKIQRASDEMRQYKVSYIDDLMKQLWGIKKGLWLPKDYIDKSSREYEQDRKRRNLQSVQRYRTRQKVQRHGIHLVPWTKKGSASLPLDDDAPDIFKKRRTRKALRRQRKQEEEQIERSRLFNNGWVSKRPRSSIRMWSPLPI
jgi:hypothetical protein